MRHILLICILSFAASFAHAANIERHALIIGNSNYAEKALINPLNDANDMAAQLATMGYKIHSGGPVLDLDRIGIERTLRAFAQQLPEDAHALFYYAGHGMATKEDNYLVPIKHDLEFQEQLSDRTVSLRSVVELMKNANPGGINVVLLDACRDNPLNRSFRSTQAGLTRLNDIPRGVFIGYAADSGQVAEDGVGRNGTYTGELLSVLREKPNVIIELAHKTVASRVYDKTGGKQFPVSENKVYGNWCFGNCEVPVSAAPVVDTGSQAPALPVVAKPAANKIPRKWLVVGGVVAAAVVVGLASSGGSDSPEAPAQEGGFTLQLRPP